MIVLGVIVLGVIVPGVIVPGVIVPVIVTDPDVHTCKHVTLTHSSHSNQQQQ